MFPEPSAEARALRDRLATFLAEHVYLNAGGDRIVQARGAVEKMLDPLQ